MAVNLSDQLQAVLEEPHVDAMQFISFDSYANAKLSSQPLLPGNDDAADEKAVAVALSCPKRKAFVPRKPHLPEMRVRLLDARSWNDYFLHIGKSAHADTKR